MKTVLRIFLTTVVVVLSVIAFGAVFLVGRWLAHREDPLSFLPDRYVAFAQVPSIRAVYDDWMNLSAADVILSRPELAPYRGALCDARGLALTRSPILRRLLDVRADIVLLPDRKLLAVLDLGWRGIFAPGSALGARMLAAQRLPGQTGCTSSPTGPSAASSICRC